MLPPRTDSALREPEPFRSYLFIVSGDLRETKDPARTIVERRARAGAWPITAGTRFRTQIAAGDRFLIYVSGERGPDTGHVIAAGHVESAPRSATPANTASDDWVGVLWRPAQEVPIRITEWLNPSVRLRPLVSQLTFIKNKRYWGNSLQGGIARLRDADFDLLCGHGPRPQSEERDSVCTGTSARSGNEESSRQQG